MQQAKDKQAATTVDFEIGELTFRLKWSNRAKYRMGKAGVEVGKGMLCDFMSLFDMAAAMNTEPTTSHLSGEDIYASLEDLPEGSEERVSKLVVEKVSEAWKAAESPGKQSAPDSKSGPSSGESG